MIGLIQRVTEASVKVEGTIIGQIQQGLLVFVAVEKGDSEKEAQKLSEKILGYRVFGDQEGKMNLNVSQAHGGLLLVSQFTLAADTQKGLRPSFTPAADPELGRALFDHFVETTRLSLPLVETGRFGADMKVSLINDGPVTFILRCQNV